MPLRDGSVVDCLDAELLELLEVIAHLLEHLGGVSFPVHDLADDAQRLLRAEGPRRVAGEPRVRQVGIILERARGFDSVDPAVATPAQPLLGVVGLSQ